MTPLAFVSGKCESVSPLRVSKPIAERLMGVMSMLSRDDRDTLISIVNEEEKHVIPLRLLNYEMFLQ